MASRRRLEQRFPFASRADHHHRLRRPVLEVLEGRVVLSTFTVNSLGDAGSGSADAGDLRYCISQANADNQANTIVFDSTIFGTPQTITLLGGQLELEDTGGTQTITGPAAGVTLIGGRESPVFQVDPGVTASFSGLSISGGVTSSGNGGGLANYGTATLTGCTLSSTGSPAYYGGGVYNSGTGNLNLTDCTVSGASASGVFNSGTASLTDCTVSDNNAYRYGGGVYNSGTGILTMTGCSISGNTVSQNGGGLANAGTAILTECTINNNYGLAAGVFNSQTGSLTLNYCTISGNSSFGDVTGGLLNDGTAYLTGCTVSYNDGGDGGGVFNGTGNLSLTGCTVTGNSATSGGGGLLNVGTANLTDCTVSGNSAAYGGGVYNSGTVNLTACTLTGNSASQGGGLVNQGSSGYTGTANLIDTIVAGNSNDIGGASNVSGSYNLIGTGGSGGLADGVDGNIVLTSLADFGLAAQANYGGPTQTIALLPGNPALGAGVIGDYPGISTPITTDQRGEPLDTPNPDIGAFQSQGFTLTLAAGSSPQSAATGTAFANPLAVTVVANNPVEPVYLGDVTFAAPAGGASANLSATTATIGSSGVTSVTATANVTAGSYTVTASAGGGDATADFALTNTGTSLSPLSFSGIISQSITYGASSVTISGTLANGSQAPLGETVAVTLDGVEQSATIGSGGAFSTAFDTAGLTVAGSPYTVIYAYTTDGTFASAGTTSTLTVNPATLTITADPESKVYGTADPAPAYTASGFQFNDTAATAMTGALARAQTGTAAGEQAGGYAISQGTLAAGSNYTISFTGNTLTITRATLTVTANAQTKFYGTADPSLTDTASGSVDTTVDGVAIDDNAASVLTGAIARAQFGTATGEQVGDYAIIQGTLAANSNYTMIFTAGTLTITPTPLTVTANTQTKVYGTADPTLTETATGFVDATVDGMTIDDTAATALTGDLARTPGETVSGGTYAITHGTLAASNYKITFTASALTITPAPLTVTANPQTKVYGTADPALTDTATGFVDATVDGVTIDDTAATALTGQLARTTGETITGGPYAIAQGTLAANSNYTITFTAGTLAITPATLFIVAEPETKVFGSADPTLTYTSSGFQFSDTAATVLTGSPARVAGETVSGSPYATGQGTLTASSNYMIQFTGSTLTITPATPALTVISLGGTYTGAPIAAAESVTGVGGAATPNLEGVTPTLAYYAGSGTSGLDLGSAAPSAAGTYTVVARFPGSADYAAAESKPVTFVIAPAAATITLTSPSSSPIYGQAVTFVATVSSVGGAPAGTVTFADGIIALATVPLNASGQAALTISTLSLGSHAITATYNGGADFLGVKSGTTAESVSPAATTIVLEPHAVLKRKKVLKAVELTATIEPVAPGGGVPTGTVAFEFLTKRRNKVKVTTLGTAAMSGGAATLTFKPNKLLNKPLTIVYSGDPEFLASTMSPPKLTKKAML